MEHQKPPRVPQYDNIQIYSSLMPEENNRYDQHAMKVMAPNLEEIPSVQHGAEMQ